MKAHDGQHHAVVASIVAEPGHSFSAGPRRAHAGECIDCLRAKNVEEHEAVLAAATREAAEDAATLTPQMAEEVRAAEEAACAEDRDRAEHEQRLNLRSRAAEEEKARAELEQARARCLAEEEEARARRLADEEVVRARRRAEEEEAVRAVDAGRRLAELEEARVRRIAEEEEASARRRAEEEEVRDRRLAELAADERRRAAILVYLSLVVSVQVHLKFHKCTFGGVVITQF